MGLTLSSRLKASRIDPKGVYVMQTFPHPESTNFDITAEYRRAIRRHEGNAVILDYLSLEGYIASRFAIEVLRRMRNVSRAAFLDTVYRTQMFRISDLRAGPYTNDCLDLTPTAYGVRRSLCECNQVAARSLSVLQASPNPSVHALQKRAGEFGRDIFGRKISCSKGDRKISPGVLLPWVSLPCR